MASAQNKKPRLWVEKLVIYKSVEPLSIIREIHLLPGLNIIWGVSPQLPDDVEGTLSGHSVGKTTFCRLLRYCLGENTFNRKNTQTRVVECLPESFVGAEIHLDGQRWSVLRPLGCKFDSHAYQGFLSDTIALKNTPDNFDSFVTLLEKTFLDSLPVNTPPQSDKKFQWGHLLAWLSRDQETRYQNLFQWRSPRSEATPMGFARQQKDPAFLIRMLLGLLDKEEVDFSKKIDKLQRKLAPLYQTKKDLEQEPNNIVNYQEKVLSSLLRKTSPIESELALWGIGSLAPGELQLRQKEILQMESECHIFDNQIASIKYWIQRWQDQRNQLGVVVDVTNEGTEPPQYENDDIKNLKAFFDKICVWGNIEFNKCEYYLNELSLEKCNEDILSRRTKRITKERKSISQSAITQIQQIQRTVDNLKSTLTSIQQSKLNTEAEIDCLKNNCRDISRAYDAWKNAIEMIEGKIPNTALCNILAQIDTLEHLLDEAQHGLTGVCGRYLNRATNISNLYDQILKSVLSNSYAGKFEVETEDIHFQIDEGNGEMSGEAVETLSLILADVTAMVWNYNNGQRHPGFLIHDSPREADLDGHIYNRFLKGVLDLMNEYGGNDAPFQYIITTTSEPPSLLKNAKVIRAELKAVPESELLFRQRLKSNQEILL